MLILIKHKNYKISGVHLSKYTDYLHLCYQINPSSGVFYYNWNEYGLLNLDKNICYEAVP